MQLLKTKSLKYLVTVVFLLLVNSVFSQEIVKDNGIEKEVLKEGKGNKPKVGDEVKVRIVGQLVTGEEFESGVLNFVIGDKDMIPGFNEVLPSMQKGEKSRYIFPPAMGYGNNAQMDGEEVIIPANESLIFEIQLLTIY